MPLNAPMDAHLHLPLFQNGIRIVPDSTELPEDAELWRYMNLSAFLMLLRGKMFIPTLAELRSEDPFESTTKCKKTRGYFANLSGPDLEWLQSKAKKHERKILTDSQTEKPQKIEVLMKVWDRELAERRTIWCWHQSSIESMAQWHVYGKNGVAIKTTPAKIKSSFDPAYVDTALIAPVQYIQDSSTVTRSHHFMRPYLLKQKCYEHEKEVRLVFPRDSDDPDGHRLLPINAKTLIAELRISPYIHRSEAIEIRQSLIQAWRTGCEWHENDDDLAVFSSDTRTVFESNIRDFEQNRCEPLGCTKFGSVTMPFVMCGDFSADKL